MATIFAKGKRVSINWLPLLLGAAAFFLVVGPRALNPANLAWLATGDPATHYLGWLFFRNAGWTFPLGLNPSYGLELANSILYSDSNPLFALLFKPLSPWLPETFQYFGIWLLVCFTLQAWFSWKLLSLVSDDSSIRALGTGLFLFAPPMIWRLHGHLSLVGHFVIIAALYLAITPALQRRKLVWCALLAVAALIHAYLLAMVLLIWCADLAGRLARHDLRADNAAIETAAVFTVVGFVCWQAGYFSVHSGISSHGYGLYRMNLLSIVDASGWSHVLRDIPEAEGDYEGFNFLGLGVIILVITALPALLTGRVKFLPLFARLPFLGALLVGLTVFAVSNKAGFGSVQLGYPLPDPMVKIANIFRASGRMFWPVFYAILIATLYIVVRGYGQRASAILLAAALSIQILDTHAGWSALREKLMAKPSSEWNIALSDPFWEQAAAKYTKVRWVTPNNYSPHWKAIATYAGTHGLATDAVYLARMDNAAIAQAQNKALESLQTGRYDGDALYILEEQVVGQALLSLNTESDVLARVDGFAVLAPGWRQCSECAALNNEIEKLDEMPGLRIGERASFSESAQHLAYLKNGWSKAEKWGTWSDGKTGTIILPLAENTATSIEIEANPLVNAMHQTQNFILFINGVPSGNIALSSTSQRSFRVPIPPQAKAIEARSRQLMLEFHFLDAVQPKAIGISDDARQLALGLVAITVR